MLVMLSILSCKMKRKHQTTIFYIRHPHFMCRHSKPVTKFTQYLYNAITYTINVFWNNTMSMYENPIYVFCWYLVPYWNDTMCVYCSTCLVELMSLIFFKLTISLHKYREVFKKSYIWTTRTNLRMSTWNSVQLRLYL